MYANLLSLQADEGRRRFFFPRGMFFFFLRKSLYVENC